MLSGITMRASGPIVLAALDEGDGAIVVLRPDPTGTYRIVDTNATFSRVTNYPREEALGIALADLHSPATDASVQRKIDEAMAQGKSLRGEIEYASRVGRGFWFGFTLMPIVDPATRILNCVLLGRDITDKRKQDNEQSAMQTMLALVFQKIDAPVVITRSDGYFLLANAAWQALLGYGAQEVPHLTARQITVPAYQDIVTTAHARQFADGKPYQLQIGLIRKDGVHILVHLSSAIVQRADMQRFRIVTLRPLDAAAEPPVTPRHSSPAVVGCVQFLGLDAIKQAYGDRWAAVGERLLLAAEKILKRRLSNDDVMSRTAGQGFCIWFKQGSEEDNSVRVTRIAREIRIMLLGELGEDADISVCGYAQEANIEEPTASQQSVMRSLDRLMAGRQADVERKAREFLDQVIKQQPSESTFLSDRSGRVIRASFVDLPRELRGRFAGAMSLVGGTRADVDTGLFRLALTANAVLEDLARGRDDIRLAAIPFGLFMNRHGREQFLQQWRSYPPSVGQQLLIMLSDVPPKVGHVRITQTAEMLRSVARRIGLMLDDIETMPPNLPTVPFSMVGLVSEALSDTPEAKLRSFIQKMHEAKTRVLVRLSVGEATQRWHALGVDLTATF